MDWQTTVALIIVFFSAGVLVRQLFSSKKSHCGGCGHGRCGSRKDDSHPLVQLQTDQEDK